METSIQKHKIQDMNASYLKKYAQAFASRTCDRFFGENFFSQKEYIHGKEILSFSPIEQVNYFVLFELFSRWQKEAARLESPYFDYAQPEVKTAMEQFMNTLSRHMRVRREDFEPVVAAAAEATLRLLLAPHQAFKNFLKAIDSQPLTGSRLKDHGRYVRTNKPVWDALLAKIELTGKNPVDFPTALVLLNEILDQENASQNSILEKPETRLPQFSAIEPLNLSELEAAETPAAPIAPQKATPKTVELQAAHQQTTHAQPSEPVKIAREEPVVGEQQLVEPHWIEPPLPPAALTPEAKMDMEHFVKSAIKPVVPLATALAEKTKAEETVFNSLQEKLNREHTTLNQRLGGDKDGSFLEKAQSQRIGSIKEGLNLNQKYYFINGLFGGDNVAFAQAIYELEQCDTLPAAMQLLENKYAPVFDWDTKSEEYEALAEVIRRKFV